MDSSLNYLCHLAFKSINSVFNSYHGKNIAERYKALGEFWFDKSKARLDLAYIPSPRI